MVGQDRRDANHVLIRWVTTIPPQQFAECVTRGSDVGTVPDADARQPVASNPIGGERLPPRRTCTAGVSHAAIRSRDCSYLPISTPKRSTSAQSTDQYSATGIRYAVRMP